MAEEPNESKLFSLSEAERLRAQIEPVLIETIESRRKLAELDEELGSSSRAHHAFGRFACFLRENRRAAGSNAIVWPKLSRRPSSRFIPPGAS